MNTKLRVARQRAVGVMIAALLVGTLAACDSGGNGSSTPTAGGTASTSDGQVTTGTATSDVDSITWYGGYRPPLSLDPLKVSDLPEQTAIPNMCESVLQVAPNLHI